MKEIAGAIKSFIDFLIFERDPEKQARRAQLREYSILKKAIAEAVRILHYQESLDELPVISTNKKNQRLREIYRKRIAKGKMSFFNLLAIE